MSDSPFRDFWVTLAATIIIINMWALPFAFNIIDTNEIKKSDCTQLRSWILNGSSDFEFAKARYDILCKDGSQITSEPIQQEDVKEFVGKIKK